jgi:GTP-binding protein
MLVDTVRLVVKAGDGGNGAATFASAPGKARGGPDGGNGGRGGDIYFQASPNITDLREFRYKKKIVGENGGHGTKHNGFGKNGTPKTTLVPLGTQITDEDTGSVISLETVDTPVCIAKGGRGGFGNVKFKSSTHQAPTRRELGELGERKNLLLELRLIAKVGLIGLPNAGKSSLLAALTNATPAIGAYPFTTLEPSLGMYGIHPIADIPGLIEGASRGVGLGLKFLRHIEKTSILIHCIDISAPDPLKDYLTVREEFRAYNPKLLEKPEIIFLNKTDLVDEKRRNAIQTLFHARAEAVFAGSAYVPESLGELKTFLTDRLSAELPS